MVKGLYTSYSGLTLQQKRLDLVSNNLANSLTTGYKKEGMSAQSFDTVYGIKIKDSSVNYINQQIGNMNLGVKIGETYRDWEQGALRATENEFDFALAGSGLFSIEYTSKQGETTTMYTRDGAFQINKDGYLLTKDGDFVLGENGRIQIPTDTEEFSVDVLGNIYADDVFIDKFALVDFEDYDYLEAFGENLYKTVDGFELKEADATVNQGYLESSNINVVNEMIDMIAIARNFESNQKIMNSIDSMLAKMVTISEL
ncbi:flagellar hook-basal body protein [Lachnospira multipara]|uniref:flagellar hook-basal body protein n=1 Tax=Lachnospira multipara TaxID=28051 RepID=UPI000480B964|nr:flagellar hook-basal body protein [Lachnospira multipara]